MKPALLCVLFLLLSPPALALDGSGVLLGTVLDGHYMTVIPNVVVTATSPNLMGEQSVVTDENGFYRIPQLPPGIYLLRFDHQQFNPYGVHVVVRLNQTYRLNVVLGPLGSSELHYDGRNQRPISAPWSLQRRTPPAPSSLEVGPMSRENGSGRWVLRRSSFSKQDSPESYGSFTRHAVESPLATAVHTYPSRHSSLLSQVGEHMRVSVNSRAQTVSWGQLAVSPSEGQDWAQTVPG